MVVFYGMLSFLLTVLLLLDESMRKSALEESYTHRNERLLLYDPDVIHSQLLTIQRKLEELTSKMTTIENDNSQLQRQSQELTSKMTTIENENSKLKSELAEVKNSTSMNGGVAFIRWGRKDCPDINGTQMIYSGIAGGGGYIEGGSGSTSLCLPHDPDKGQSNFPYALQYDTGVAHVWGAEYQYDYRDVKVNDDVPCAACIDTRATTTIMVPGKSSCPSGWTKQYVGHVCASKYDHAQTEYTCVDDNPQYFEGRRQNLDGRLFYPAITVCGSLPCPPYENAQYLKCSVCTK